MNELALCILDVRLVIHCEDTRVLDEIQSCFATYVCHSIERPDHVIRFDARGRRCWSVSVNGRSEEVRMGKPFPPHGSVIKLLLPMARRDLLFVHASAVAWNGKAIIFVGQSTSGKTTLALGLAAAGWEFLADDLTPVDLERFAVYPFRARPGIRPNTRTLLGNLNLEHAHDGTAPSCGKAVPVQAILFLHHGFDPASAPLTLKDTRAEWNKLCTLTVGEAVEMEEGCEKRLYARDKRDFERHPTVEEMSVMEALQNWVEFSDTRRRTLVDTLERCSRFLRRHRLLKLSPGYLDETVAMVQDVLV